MPSQSEFELSGRIVWDEQPQYPGDAFRMQSAMFSDRPDLHVIAKRKAHRPVKVQPGQIAFQSNEGKEVFYGK